MPNWRESYKQPKFLVILDARVAVLALAAVMYPAKWLFGVLILVTVFLWYIEKRLEMNVSSALRGIRSIFAGRFRPSTIESKRRGTVDYERLG